MKMTTLLATVMGLALVFGTAANSEAWCLFGCADVDNSADRFNSDNINGDQVGGDKFDRLADTITDSVVTTNQNIGANTDGTSVGNTEGAGSKVNVGASVNIAGIDKSHNNDNAFNINTNIGDNNQ